jgi:hypothetical protein
VKSFPEKSRWGVERFGFWWNGRAQLKKIRSHFKRHQTQSSFYAFSEQTNLLKLKIYFLGTVTYYPSNLLILNLVKYCFIVYPWIC